MSASLIARRSTLKPEKPAPPPNSPIRAHANGSWYVKRRGKIYYLGPWADLERAQRLYHANVENIEHGRPLVDPDLADGVTLADLCNAWLTSKERLVASGELAPGTFRQYKRVCDGVTTALRLHVAIDDLSVNDFEKLRRYFGAKFNPNTLALQLKICRGLFAYAFDAGLTDTPIRTGRALQPPAMKDRRRAMRRNGARLFTPEECRRLFDAAEAPHRAMLLLALNAALLPTDLARLQRADLDLTGRWLDTIRHKTGTERRAKLWPETVDAIREALDVRPPSRLPNVFLRKNRQPWPAGDAAQMGDWFRRFAKGLGVYEQGRTSLKVLRKNFRTVAMNAVGDAEAVALVMGHTPQSIGAEHYQEVVADERLERIADAVRQWWKGEK